MQEYKNDELYQHLLQRPEWLNRRDWILHRDGHRCRNCGSQTSLQVHHRQYHFDTRTGNYRLPWDYDDVNLITLCESCHQKGHQLYTIPVFNV